MRSTGLRNRRTKLSELLGLQRGNPQFTGQKPGDPTRGIAYLRELIQEARGNVSRMAQLEGVHRSGLTRMLLRFGLWQDLAVARRARVKHIERGQPNRLILAARRALMDEQLQQVVEQCAGMSEDEIVQMIASSANVDAFPDPGLVAAYISSQANAAG